MVTNPDSAFAPQTLSAPAANDWRNQGVFALGAAIDLAPDTKLRLGFN